LRREDNTLEIRAILLVVGASLAFAGMATGRSWMINSAIGVIAVGLVLAIHRKRRREERSLEE
jgi:hypothetical protein